MNDRERKRRRCNFVPINERQQLTRKQISRQLHHESYNDQNVKIYTLKDQLSLLNQSNTDQAIEIDKKLQNKIYKKTGKGMINLLDDLCDLEKKENDGINDDNYNKQKQRIINLNKMSESYDGDLKEIELTKDIKSLTFETRERALIKLLKIIKENWLNNNNKNINDKLLKNMSIECELNICKKAKTSIEYGKYVRDELQNIRKMTKEKTNFEIALQSQDEDECQDEDESESSSDSGSGSESEDDDLPINLRLNKNNSS